ncbi:MAG: hypothetical protein OIF50_08225 [Flavobacteriaceae bacterium]|nr:hypothetical protein [Flavobacteriaceae bacterium]
MSASASVKLGVRLDKARIMDTHVATLSKIKKTELVTIEAMQKQFALCLEIMEQLTEKESSKKANVNIRQEGFNYSDEENMMVLLTDIRNYIMGKRAITKTRKQDILKLIRKIRGTRILKKPATSSNPIAIAGSTAEEASYYNNKTLGYGNKLANFKRIIVILAILGPTYTPPNEKIQLTALQKFYERLEKQSRTVVISKKDHGSIRRQSIVQGRILMEYCSDLKLIIKSTYRDNSPEFAPVKSIRFV